MTVKSAMMTTSARVTNTDGRECRLVHPRRRRGPCRARCSIPVWSPVGDGDWLAYIEGHGVDGFDEVEPIDPSDYNSPSIAIGSLVGTQTVTRG